jgi:hypothetical protein
VVKTVTDDLIEAGEPDDPGSALYEAENRLRLTDEGGPEHWAALFMRGQALADLGRHAEALADYSNAAAGFVCDMDQYAANFAVVLFQRARSLEAIGRAEVGAMDDAAALAAHPQAYMSCVRQTRSGPLH